MITGEDAIKMSYIEALLKEAIDYQTRIQTCREYHVGIQPVSMSERATEFLGLHDDEENKFRMNVCKGVVNAVLDEMKVIGFSGSDEKENAELKFIQEWWTKNRMDAKQKDLYEAALRDGESFLLLEYDEKSKNVEPTLCQRFVSTEAGGDGFGAWMLYENDDVNQKPIAAVKQWEDQTVDADGNSTFETRRNIYYADRIEKYALKEDGWKLTGTLTLKTVDGKQPDAGYIQVIHFKNVGLSPEAIDAIPMQDAVNKTLVDALSAADLTAFRTYFLFGSYPTTDGKQPQANGSNAWRMGPGQINGSSSPEASVQVVDGADTGPIMNMLKDLVVMTAQVTDTPLSRFVVTGQIASEKTLKEQEQPIKRKAETRRVLWGNSWEDTFKVVMFLTSHYTTTKLDETKLVEVVWEKYASMDDVKDKKSLDVPVEALWEEIYSDEKVEQMTHDHVYLAERMKVVLDGITAAEANGLSMEFYLKQIGYAEEEIKDFVKNRGEVVPPKGLEQ